MLKWGAILVSTMLQLEGFGIAKKCPGQFSSSSSCHYHYIFIGCVGLFYDTPAQILPIIILLAYYCISNFFLRLRMRRSRFMRTRNGGQTREGKSAMGRLRCLCLEGRCVICPHTEIAWPSWKTEVCWWLGGRENFAFFREREGEMVGRKRRQKKLFGVRMKWQRGMDNVAW